MIRQQTTQLSSAQILALHATPVEVAPAPPAGQSIIPLSVLLEYDFGTLAYVTAGDATIYVSSAAAWALGEYLLQDRNTILLAPGSRSEIAVALSSVDPAALDGQPLVVALFDPLTGGNGTLKVTTSYAVSGEGAPSGVAFATPGDVAALLGRPLTVAEEAQASLVLDIIGGIISEIAGRSFSSPPSYFRGLSIEKARAVVTNPDGAERTTEILGDYSMTVSRRITAASGGEALSVGLTQLEERIVRRIANNRVSIATPTQGMPEQIYVRENT